MAYYNPTHTGQQQVPYPGPIVYYAAPTFAYHSALVKPYGTYYNTETSIGLGAIQIALACISGAAAITAIVCAAAYWYVGIGLWTAAFYLIAGSLAVAAGKDPTYGLIKATLVFSVFDILFGIAQIATAACGVIVDLHCHGNHNSVCNDWDEAAVVANSMMIGVGALEIIIGFWMMGVSAHAIVKGSKAQHAIVPVAYAPNQPQPVFIQAPSSLQSQPPFPQSQPPPYYDQQQSPSTSNQQQMTQVGDPQVPPKNIKH